MPGLIAFPVSKPKTGSSGQAGYENARPLDMARRLGGAERWAMRPDPRHMPQPARLYPLDQCGCRRHAAVAAAAAATRHYPGDQQRQLATARAQSEGAARGIPRETALGPGFRHKKPGIERGARSSSCKGTVL